MGKNRDRETLIRFLVNTVVHEVVRKHTNRPESEDFLLNEVVEYRGRAEKMLEDHTWNLEDKEYIGEKCLKGILEKLDGKYSDVAYDIEKVESFLGKELSEFGLS